MRRPSPLGESRQTSHGVVQSSDRPVAAGAKVEPPGMRPRPRLHQAAAGRREPSQIPP